MLNPLNDVRNLKDPLKQFVCNMTLAFPANSQLNQYIDVKDLVLPNILQRELVSYLDRKQEIKRDYYFEDIIDELVNLDEIPSKKKKLSSFNN